MELEQVQQKNAVLLSEERQRCDALVADNEDIQRRLEEQRAQIEQCLTQLRTKEEQIVELSEKDDLRDVQLEKNETSLLLQIQQLKEELAAKDREVRSSTKKRSTDVCFFFQGDEDRGKEFHLREILEGQIIELNEDLQSMESEKNDLHQQVTQLKDQIRQFENTSLSPGSPAVPVSSSPDTRTRSPSPSTFEHVLELEAQILRNEEQMRELNSVYDRFITLLPIELSSTDEHQQSSLSHRFVHLFEQWSTYVDTLSITQQELDSLKQLLIEKQEDLEKLQFDLDLTTTKLIEEQQAAKEQSSRIEDNVDDEEEIEHILEVHRHAQRAPSRQSLISSTPGEKQQLIAQNELLSTLLAEKDRELIGLQQAEKTREDLLKNLETLRNQMRQIELEQEFKQVELNDIRNVLDEKIRENSSLKKEKMSFIEKLADLERDRQEQQSMIQVQPKQAIQEEEEKPTTVAESTENKTFDQEQFDKLRADYDQLVEFSKKQHDESLSYYNEYARILALHNELNSKQSQLQVDYDSLQSLIQQKNEAYLQCQNELNNYQNLFYHEKKKAEEVDLLRSTLIERENKLQQYLANERDFLVKQAELERELKVLEQKNFDYQGEESLQLELERTRDERDLVVVEKKQMENEIEATRQKVRFSRFDAHRRFLRFSRPSGKNANVNWPVKSIDYANIFYKWKNLTPRISWLPKIERKHWEIRSHSSKILIRHRTNWFNSWTPAENNQSKPWSRSWPRWNTNSANWTSRTRIWINSCNIRWNVRRIFRTFSNSSNEVGDHFQGDIFRPESHRFRTRTTSQRTSSTISRCSAWSNCPRQSIDQWKQWDSSTFDRV